MTCVCICWSVAVEFLAFSDRFLCDNYSDCHTCNDTDALLNKSLDFSLGKQRWCGEWGFLG